MPHCPAMITKMTKHVIHTWPKSNQWNHVPFFLCSDEYNCKAWSFKVSGKFKLVNLGAYLVEYLFDVHTNSKPEKWRWYVISTSIPYDLPGILRSNIAARYVSFAVTNCNKSPQLLERLFSVEFKSLYKGITIHVTIIGSSVSSHFVKYACHN